MVKRAHHSVIESRFLEEIDAAQKSNAVTEHAEHARAQAPPARIPGAPILLRHVEINRIQAMIDWHRVSESAIAFMAENFLIACVSDGAGMDGNPPTLAVIIWRPQISCRIGIEI